MGTNGKEISCEHFPKNPEKNEIRNASNWNQNSIEEEIQL